MTEIEPTLIDAINLEHSGYFHSKTSAKLAQILGYGEKTKDFQYLMPWFWLQVLLGTCS